MLSRLKKQANELKDTVSQSMAKEQCGRCRAMFYQLTNCPCCYVRVCGGKCSEKVSVLDTSVLDPRWSGHKEVGASLTLSVCLPCAETCAKANCEKFREEASTFSANVEAFLKDPGSAILYPRPDAAVTKTDAAATARRLAPLAKKALELTGYSAIVQYTTMVVEAGSVAALVLSPQAKVLCDRVMPILRRHFFTPREDDLDDTLDEKDDDDDDGMKKSSDSLSRAAWTAAKQGYQRALQLGPSSSTKRYASEATELALRLYYFGCSTAVDRLRRDDNDEPKNQTEAGDDVLDRAGDSTNVGGAWWLYASRTLRIPHDGPDWGAWYAGRLAKRDGFTLLACMGASRSESALAVPTRPPTPFPAWCLVADRKRRLALLAIRGSVTQGDWLVNSDAKPITVFGETKGHGGIVKAARAILDDCGVRECLRSLAQAGYEIRTVGHSLGAGVAVLAAALLREEDSIDASCVAYAAPACVDPRLADALKPHVLSIVHRDDLVPRLSDVNCARLAKDLQADDANYRSRLAADKASLKTHIATLGKVQAMSHNDVAPPKVDDDEKNDDVKAPEPRRRPPTEDDSTILRLVPPGTILYLNARDATYAAVQGNAESLDLDRIIVSSRAVDDHMMPEHVAALRGVRWVRGRVPPVGHPPRFRSGVNPDGTYVP